MMRQELCIRSWRGVSSLLLMAGLNDLAHPIIGPDTTESEAPIEMASLLLKNGDVKCSATPIGPQVFVTASACLGALDDVKAAIADRDHDIEGFGFQEKPREQSTNMAACVTGAEVTQITPGRFRIGFPTLPISWRSYSEERR